MSHTKHYGLSCVYSMHDYSITLLAVVEGPREMMMMMMMLHIIVKLLTGYDA